MSRTFSYLMGSCHKMSINCRREHSNCALEKSDSHLPASQNSCHPRGTGRHLETGMASSLLHSSRYMFPESNHETTSVMPELRRTL